MLGLLIAGLVTLVVGLLAIGFGIPVKEFSFGNTLIVTGVLGVCTGLLLFALALVVRELKTIARALEASAGRPRDGLDPFAAQSAQVPGRVAGAGAGIPASHPNVPRFPVGWPGQAPVSRRRIPTRGLCRPRPLRRGKARAGAASVHGVWNRRLHRRLLPCRRRNLRNRPRSAETCCSCHPSATAPRRLTQPLMPRHLHRNLVCRSKTHGRPPTGSLRLRHRGAPGVPRTRGKGRTQGRFLPLRHRFAGLPKRRR